MTITTQIVEANGFRFAVDQAGEGDHLALCLHGFPESRFSWRHQIPLLADMGYRVWAPDLRGYGETEPKPSAVADYCVDRLMEDVAALLDASGAKRVTLIGHDWGAATMWEVLSRPAAAERVASYTSISGPDPQHLSRFIRGGLAHPNRPRRFAQALSQAVHFSYMIGFSVPVLAPAVMRAFGARAINRWFIAPGIPAQQRHQADTFVADATNGLKIYRANFLRALTSARRDRYVTVPVQLIVNSEDVFVRPYVYDDTPRWVSRLWRRDIRAGHWSPVSHPEVVATAVAEFVGHLDGAPASPALLSARVAASA